MTTGALRSAASLVLAAAFALPRFVGALEPGEAQALLVRLLSSDEARRKTARAGIARSGDRTLIPHLVDALFFAPAEGRADVAACLEALSGVRLGDRHRYWVEWIGAHEEIRPAPGYRAWKAALFARIDPAFGRFLDPRRPLRVRAEEIVWGGVVKDGIPALRNPKVVPAAEAGFLSDGETVFGVAFEGEHRAYPQRVLDWHEMVNDVVGGTPFAISYCTLCGSAVAYGTRGADGVHVFGSSGLLYRSNKLMYDAATESLWSNLTGEPVAGPLAGTGIALPMLPVTVTTWGQWRGLHPDTSVASLDTGFARDYASGAAYGAYFASPDPMFPVWKRSDALAPKEWIYALRSGGAARAYPLELLLRERVVNDAVGSTPAVLVADPASGAVRAFARGDRILAEGAVPGTLIEPARGEIWSVEEAALVSRGDAAPLPRIPGHRAYWFGWYAFFPETTLYEGCMR